MRRISSYCVALALLLSGCTENLPVAWEAQQEMDVFVDTDRNAYVVKFRLLPGDICVPGGKAYSKTFAYTEIVCPRRGAGWVRATQFKVFDSKRPEGMPLTTQVGRSYP
jgi:hypothetical protein